MSSNWNAHKKWKMTKYSFESWKNIFINSCKSWSHMGCSRTKKSDWVGISFKWWKEKTYKRDSRKLGKHCVNHNQTFHFSKQRKFILKSVSNIRRFQRIGNVSNNTNISLSPLSHFKFFQPEKRTNFETFTRM
jgi:hypothetical protein